MLLYSLCMYKLFDLLIIFFNLIFNIDLYFNFKF